MEFIRAEKGADVLDRVLSRLPSAERVLITSVKPTDEVPLDLVLSLWHAADEELGEEDKDSGRS